QKPDRPEMWVALATSWEREKPEKALEILAEAERRLGDRMELRLARMRHWSYQAGEENLAALAKLEQGLDKFSPAEQARLQRALAEAHYRLGDPKDAERLWTQVAQQQKGDLRIRLVLFDLALLHGDETALKRLIA